METYQSQHIEKLPGVKLEQCPQVGVSRLTCSQVNIFTQVSQKCHRHAIIHTVPLAHAHTHTQGIDKQVNAFIHLTDCLLTGKVNPNCKHRYYYSISVGMLKQAFNP